MNLFLMAMTLSATSCLTFGRKMCDNKIDVNLLALWIMQKQNLQHILLSIDLKLLVVERQRLEMF